MARQEHAGARLSLTGTRVAFVLCSWAIAVLLWSARPSVARADDAEVEADTTLQAYDVDSPGTNVIWSRRRLTQSLGLRYVKPLDEPDDDSSAPPPSLQAHLRLRLNQEFGDTCAPADKLCFAIVNPARRGSYTPVASNGLLEMPLAYVELRDLPYGVSLQAGRVLESNAVGFMRVDGAAARAEPSSWLAFEFHFGALVQRDAVAGSDAFVPDGLPRLDLGQNELARSPYIAAPQTIWAADGSIELGEERYVRGSLTYRTLLEQGGLIQRRVGAGLVSQPMPALRLASHTVFDLIDPALIDAQLSSYVTLAPWHAELELERHVPRFDASTIWAFFDVAPVWIATLSGGREITANWDATLSLHARRTDLPSHADNDAGAELTSSWHSPHDQLILSAFGWNGGTGPLWGSSASLAHRLTLAVTLEAEASLMRVDDPLRAAIAGVSIYELLGVRFAITDESQLRIALSHAQSDPVGHRVSLLAFFHLGAWR